MPRLPSMDRSDAAPAGVIYCEQTVLRGCIYCRICMMGSHLNAWRMGLLKKRCHCCIVVFFFLSCALFKGSFHENVLYVCLFLPCGLISQLQASINRLSLSFLSVSVSSYFGKQQTKHPAWLQVTLPVINGLHLLNTAAIPMGDCIETSGYRCIDLFEDNEVCLHGPQSPCCHGDIVQEVFNCLISL